jgi:hypothetical protein
MPEGNRKGKRFDRNLNLNSRIPNKGYYIILTDTEQTEKNYFDGLKRQIPPKLKGQLVIKTRKVALKDIVSEALNEVAKNPQWVRPWLVFDRDRVPDFDKIIQEANINHVDVAWSNPCIEIWFFSYFGKTPSIHESNICCEKFSAAFSQLYGIDYDKADPLIFESLLIKGNIKAAIEKSRKRDEQYKEDCSCPKPSECCPNNTVYKLVDELLHKINK